MLRFLFKSCVLSLAVLSLPVSADDMNGEELYQLCSEQAESCAARFNRVIQPYVEPADGSAPKICIPAEVSEAAQVDGLVQYMDAKQRRNSSWLGRQNADRMIGVYFMLEYRCP